jgi:hypothetical protein
VPGVLPYSVAGWSSRGQRGQHRTAEGNTGQQRAAEGSRDQPRQEVQRERKYNKGRQQTETRGSQRETKGDKRETKGASYY